MLQVVEAALDVANVGESKIAQLLQDLAAVTSQPEIAAEAWIALMATGQAPPMPVHSAVPEKIRWQCARIVDELRDPVVRFEHEAKTEDGERESIWSVLNRWLPTLPEQEAVGVFRLVMQSLTDAVGKPIKPRLAWQGEEGSPMKLALWGEEWAVALSGRQDDVVYYFAVALDTLKFGSDPIQVFRQCDAIIQSANSRFVPGSDYGIRTQATLSSNDQVLDYFFTTLQILCEAAGMIKTEHGDFRATLFNEVTEKLFKRQGLLPPMLILLADYLGASGEADFAISPDEFRQMRQRFSNIELNVYPLSAEWMLADALNSGSSSSPSVSVSDVDMAMRLCRSDGLS
jgi:hypothetical protein